MLPLLLTLASMTASAHAVAEAATPAPQAVVIAPKVKKDDGAQYPKEALAAGMLDPLTVVLIVEVNVDGTVRRAIVDRSSTVASVDAAAVAAGENLLFEPATRAGKPVAAKIRFTYQFVRPRSRFSGRVTSQQGLPLDHAVVDVVGVDGVRRSVITDSSGRWAIEGLVAGKYTVAVTHPDHQAQAADEVLSAGEVANVTSRLAKMTAPELAPRAPVARLSTEEVRPIEEVRVRGVKPPREVTRRTVDDREINRIPGTGGDALRSIQNLPGVARPPGLAGLLIVRGAAPQDTNVFVDGTLIPIVYHFGGLTSVIPTQLTDKADLNLIEKIDFYPGNFSAQYGRVMGGVVDVGIRNPKSDGKVHVTGSLDLIDARVLAQTPVFNSGWTLTLAGRRSWVDAVLKPVFAASGATVTTAPVYYDFQAIANREFGKNQDLRLFFFGSDDRLQLLTSSLPGSQPAAGGNLSAHTGFWRMQARYRNRIGRNTELRLVSAIGKDVIDFAFGDLMFRLDSTPISVRGEVNHKLSSRLSANVGIDWLVTPYSVIVRAPPAPRPGEPPAGPFLSQLPITTQETSTLYRPAAYAELEMTPWRAGRIVPGVRLDYAADAKAWDLSPRFNFRQDLPTERRTTIKGGAGVYAQPPQPQETSSTFGQANLRSNRSIHYTLGAERELTDEVELSVDGFYKDLDSLVVARAGNSGIGRIFGLETLLRWKPRGRFFGWLAYTLMRSERRDTPDSPWRTTPFDQTHILTVLGSYQLGRGWEVGARFRLVSGNLTTPQQYGFYDANTGVYLPTLAVPPFSERLPLFHQLDVRVDKTWRLGVRGNIHFYLDVINAYNQGNVEAVGYNYNQTKRSYVTGLPFIPNLGFSWEY